MASYSSWGEMWRTCGSGDCTAIRKALIKLGYINTYHGFAPGFENPRDSEMWLDAMRAKYDGKGRPFGRAEFDKLLGHCQVSVAVTRAREHLPHHRQWLSAYDCSRLERRSLSPLGNVQLMAGRPSTKIRLPL